MLRRSIPLILLFVLISSLWSGCIPRHSPHTPKPVSDAQCP